MTISQKIFALAVTAGLSLLAGCGEEAVDDLDRIDAAPAAKVSADAIAPPGRERETSPSATDNAENNGKY